MHYVAEGNEPKMMQWLLTQGFDLDARDNKGQTPRDYAIKEEADEVLKAFNSGAFGLFLLRNGMTCSIR